MSFRLAHISDIHLPPLPAGSIFGHFSGKRVIGGLSWHLRRKYLHRTDILKAVLSSLATAKPDHIANTGDMLNLAAPNEFPPAVRFMAAMQNPRDMSFVPGNHDAYVPLEWEKGLKHFVPWMESDRVTPGANPFPFLRLRRNVALIGLNSGYPQPYHRAGGHLGEQQLRDLGHLLLQTAEQGFCRIVMIHHPPLPNLTAPLRALEDADALRDVLCKTGCEAVLHGHNHTATLHWLDTATGPCPIIGAPSASFVGDGNHHPAGWSLLSIRRHQGNWQMEMTRYRWQPATGSCAAEPSALLLPP